MAIDPRPPRSRAATHELDLARPVVRGGGTAGNARLTASTGVVLLALLAIIGVRLLDLSGLLSVHLFVGLVLIGPVLMKIGSTGYRFARYYGADPAYRRKGSPPAVLRLIAPIVIVSTLVVLLSGVALLVLGPSSGAALLPVHKASFVVWAAVFSVHVLGHLAELPGLLRAVLAATRTRTRGAGSLSLSGDVTGRAGRMLALAGALVVLALALLPDFGAWLHSSLREAGRASVTPSERA
jgi:hypothetical protein